MELGKIPIDEVEASFGECTVDPRVIDLLPGTTSEMIKRLVHQFENECGFGACVAG